MSCFKIFFIFTKLILIFNFTYAAAKEPDKVIVAKINDHLITAQDVLNVANNLPKNIKEKSLSEIYPNIVNELINQHLVTELAYKEKLDQNKKIIAILKKNKNQIMAKYWLKNFLDNKTTEKNIKDFYNKYLENFKSSKEYNASHILVKKEDEALQIIKKMKDKSQFSKFAKIKTCIHPQNCMAKSSLTMQPCKAVARPYDAPLALRSPQTNVQV